MSLQPSETSTVKQHLQQFSSAQQIRVQNYKQLQRGFEALLQSKNEAAYK